MNFGSLFTGGGGADIGAREAGLELARGVEYIPEIAAWANAQLGEHVRCLNILEADPADFEPVDFLHASPPCPSFSVANSNKGETELDVSLGEKTAEFIRAIRPKYFTLENVYGYRHSQSWAAIVGALHECGYGFIVEHINSADYGVPQKRRRMIVRAVRDTFFSPQPLRPTHSEGGTGGLAPWVGWWEAVVDIAHTFPESKLAKWQVERLNGSIEGTVLVRAGNPSKWDDNPMTEEPQEPAPTTRSDRVEIPRAILAAVSGEASDYFEGGDPAQTVTNGHGAGKYRAVLVGARVVALTPRALARFQTFPDWYELPEKKTLAVTIIGNAVPPLLMRRIVESLI